jgi:hypothetical protein
LLAWRACVWWGGLVDAADVARRFGLGPAARLSDGPVARGKQGLVWRLDTEDGSWAVKVPFHRSSEDEVRVALQPCSAHHHKSVRNAVLDRKIIRTHAMPTKRRHETAIRGTADRKS